jgi:predicted nucleic acid-binding protein
MRWQDWGESAAEMFGVQKAGLEARGVLIDDWNIVIGASAIVLEASVATCNPRNFKQLTGLHVMDWSRMPR